MEHDVSGIRTRDGSGEGPGTEGGSISRPALGLDAPRRVLMTTSGNRSTWDHTLDLAGAMGRRGTEVVLASIGEAPDHVQLGEAADLPNVQVFPNRFASKYSDDTWDEVERAGSWLLQMERTLKPDLVHLHSYPFGALPFEAPTLLEGHDCPLCRWQVVRGGSTPMLWERYRASVSRALASARMVVTPTHAALAELGDLYGDLPPSRVIPIGRGAERFLPLEKRKLVLSAGCFGDEAQNLPALEQVARELRWPVTVVIDGCPGPGDAGERPLDLLENPSTEILSQAYGHASIFTLPCSYEPAGISVLEAALAGCALVLGDVPALRELWEGAALFVSPGDPDDLQRALELLMNEPKGLRGLRRRSRDRALLLSPERRATSFLETYSRLLSGQPDAGMTLEAAS